MVLDPKKKVFFNYIYHTTGSSGYINIWEMREGEKKINFGRF